MNFISKSVEARLLLIISAGVGLVLVAALAGFMGLWNSIQTLERAANTSLSYQGGVLEMAVSFKEQVQEWKNVLLRGSDPKALEKYWGHFEKREAAVQERGRSLLNGLEQENARAFIQQFLDAHMEMGRKYRIGLQAYKDDNFRASTGDAAVKGIDRQPVELLEAAVKLIKEDSSSLVAEGKGKGRTTALASLFLIMLAVVVILAVSIMQLRRHICRPLGMTSRAIDALVRGEAVGQLDVRSEDEIGRLADATRRLNKTFEHFAQAQSELHRRHEEEGAMQARLPEADFPGVYGRMAQSINSLLDSQAELTHQVVEVVSSYAMGNLAVDMPNLPGEKAEITEAMGKVKASLQAINEQIHLLVDAAAVGNFTVRGDVGGFQYSFKSMVENLNHLMETAQQGLNDVKRVLVAISAGDLTQRIDRHCEGTFGELKDCCNTTADKLSEMVLQIREASQAINGAAQEIASGNADLSQRTEEQAGSLEETAASMEELTSTIKQNAENARQAHQLATGSADIAGKGGDVVSRVVHTMDSINASSHKIVDIISVIDGIAFQTNILALNAAVEAARAGEQGRGFAVVASEVRNLAQRSAGAAKEIKALISDSVGKVDDGAKLVKEAGSTMEEIVTSIRRVTDLMSEMAAAASEQSQGVEQINNAITQMDDVTQQNAALVEEAAAAAESLGEQAGRLVTTVASFTLAGLVQPDVERAAPARAWLRLA